MRGRQHMGKILNVVGSSQPKPNEKRTKLDVLLEQILDSLIVGGITGLSTYISAGVDASWKSALISGALVFLIKLKEYRGIT